LAIWRTGKGRPTAGPFPRRDITVTMNGPRRGNPDRQGLWLAAQLADELSITAGPDLTAVSLYVSLSEVAPSTSR